MINVGRDTVKHASPITLYDMVDDETWDQVGHNTQDQLWFKVGLQTSALIKQRLWAYIAGDINVIS